MILAPEDKKALAQLLLKMKLTTPQFTGRLTINVGQGSINDIEKYEKFK